MDSKVAVGKVGFAISRRDPVEFDALGSSAQPSTVARSERKTWKLIAVDSTTPSDHPPASFLFRNEELTGRLLQEEGHVAELGTNKHFRKGLIC